MQKNKTHRLIGVSGVLAVIVFFLMWFMAAAEDPAWIFGENMLSTLGVSVSGNAAIIFNIGCIVSGLLIMVSGMGVAILTKKEYSAAGVAIAFGGLFLVLVGLFPEDLETMHNIVAGSLFLFLIAGMLLMTVGDWKENRVFFGGLAMLFLAAILGAVLTQELALAETIASILILVWFGFNAIKITVRQNIQS
jgi:Predicted membrane protein